MQVMPGILILLTGTVHVLDSTRLLINTILIHSIKTTNNAAHKAFSSFNEAYIVVKTIYILAIFGFSV